MAARSVPIRVDPDSELGQVLRDPASTREPVLVDAGGQILEIEVHPVTLETDQTVSTAEQADRAINGIPAASGGWRDIVDTQALTDNGYQRR